jgi:PAS domain S-box-containing protein
MATSTGRGNEIFLLMVSLTQVRDRDTVVRLFTQAASSMFEHLEFEFAPDRERSGQHALDLVTSKGLFGRILVRGPWESVDSDTMALIQNAIVMLALILENLSQEKELAEQRDLLKKEVVRKTAELLQANEDLKQEVEERARAQESLEQKTEELERYFTESLDLLCIADTDGYLLRLNPEWKTTLGYELSELEGRQFLEFVHPEDVEATVEAVFQLKAQKEVRNFENRYQCKDGTYRWIEWRSRSEGKLIYAVARDVTDRRLAEQALRESEARFRALSEHTFEAIFLSEKGLCTGQNLAAEKMFGYTAEEALGKPGTDWIAPEHRDLVRQNMLLDYGELYEVLALRKDGTTFPCQIQGKMVEHEGRGIRVTSLRDITDRKRAEQSLRDSENKYRTLVERIPAIIYIAALDEASTTTYISPQIEAMLGFSPFEYRDDPDLWRKRLHPEDRRRVIAEVTRCHETGETFMQEYRIIQREGGIVWLRDEAALVYDQDGKPLFLQGIMFDITDRKKAEENLSES